MMPTLRELEAASQKPNWREVGSWLARRVARPAALYITWLTVRWPVSANVVTAFTLALGLLAAYLLGHGTLTTFWVGAIALDLWYLFDHVDGQVARFRRSESVTGVYFDFMMHHLVHPSVVFALGYGVAVQSGELFWTLAGAAFAGGVLCLALSNDCQYKAFHTAMTNGLGSVVQAARLQDPLQGRLQDPRLQDVSARLHGPVKEFAGEPPALRRLVGLAHAASLRLCEMPNIILAVTGLAVAQAINPPVGLRMLQSYVAILSILAPWLGLARLAKHVWLGRPDTEFRKFLNDAAPARGGR